VRPGRSRSPFSRAKPHRLPFPRPRRPPQLADFGWKGLAPLGLAFCLEKLLRLGRLPTVALRSTSGGASADSAAAGSCCAGRAAGRPGRSRSPKALGQRSLARSRVKFLTFPMRLWYGSYSDENHPNARCQTRREPKLINPERAMESAGNNRLRVGEQAPPSSRPSPPYLFSAQGRALRLG
jgi:hypothetical protein